MLFETRPVGWDETPLEVCFLRLTVLFVVYRGC